MNKSKQNIPQSNLSQQIQSSNAWDAGVFIKILCQSIVKIFENEVTCNWKQQHEKKVDYDPNSKSFMNCVWGEQPFNFKES